METKTCWLCILCLLLLSACRQAEKQVVARTVFTTKETAALATVVETQLAKAPALPIYPPPYDTTGGSYAVPESDELSASQMVIKEASIQLLVEDIPLAVDQVTQLAVEYDGYVLSSSSQSETDNQYATLRLAIPSDHFEAALGALRQIGVQILSENLSGKDVGAQYVDLQSRLNSLEATAARLRQLLDEAKNVQEALQVNAALSDVETQIEQIKGQMKYYEGRSAFSIITVDLSLYVPTATAEPPTPTPAWNPGETFQQASQVMISSAQGLADGVIWVIVVGGPYLIVLGAFYGLGRLLFRWLKRKKIG